MCIRDRIEDTLHIKKLDADYWDSMKDELKAIGEEDNGLKSLNQLQAQLSSLSNREISIFRDNGTLKSLRQSRTELYLPTFLETAK